MLDRRRLSRVVRSLLVLVAGGLACASPARAMVPGPPPQQAVAIVARGVVWFDDGSAYLEGFWSGTVRLGAVHGVNASSPIASSATAVAVGRDEEEGEFLGDVPRRAPETIAPPRLFGGDGCRGWQPRENDFVVAGEDLVAAAECHWEQASVREPLLIRNLRGGAWRVLRWLPGKSEPVLAAEGGLLASIRQ